MLCKVFVIISKQLARLILTWMQLLVKKSNQNRNNMFTHKHSLSNISFFRFVSRFFRILIGVQATQYRQITSKGYYAVLSFFFFRYYLVDHVVLHYFSFLFFLKKKILHHRRYIYCSFLQYE